MANTISFPNSSEGFTSLARLNADKGRYDDAVFYAYKALQAGADREETVVFIARNLMASENFSEALRVLYRSFPHADKRPSAVMHAVRDGMYCIHEYMQAHHIEDEIIRRGEKLEPSAYEDSVESFLSQYDLMLNDTVAFGCDGSSMTDIWCDARPIMAIAAVQNAFYSLADGRFSQTVFSMREALIHAYETDESSVAEEYIAESAGLFMTSSILSGDFESYKWCLESMESADVGMPKTLSCMVAVALVSKYSEENAPWFAQIPDDPETSREELLSIVVSLIIAGEKKAAYERMKRLLPYAEYNIGINRLYAYLAVENGDKKGALCAYERIHKLIPWDSSEDFYRREVLSCVNANKEFRRPLPVSCEDREEAGEDAIELLSVLLANPLKKIEENITEGDADMLASVFRGLKETVQVQTAKLLSPSRDERIIDLMQRILLDPCADAEAKAIILKAFSRDPERKSAVVCIAGNFCEAYPHMHTDLSMPEAYYEQYKRCYNIAVRSYGAICALCVNYYYEYISKFCFNDPDLYEEIDMSESFAAVVLSMALHTCGIDETTDDILDGIYTEVTIDDVIEAVDFIESNERGYLYDLYGNV